MCYITLLSTSDDIDLSQGNTPLLRFDPQLPGVPEERYLRFAHKWHVRSASDCSCQRRHLMAPSDDFGFGEPADWFPENEEDIEATLRFVACIKSLVSRGAGVDCVDARAHGNGKPASPAGELEVDLAEVRGTSFRFFENYCFTFIKP
jgi:hypothetical protein